jgi:glutamate N-acetyltransferase/amino-acid N-acetyltransferase
MLVVITTDAAVEGSLLDAALRKATRLSFDRLDSDGATSTNDQVTLMASGASGIVPETEEFQELLTQVCLDLAEQLMNDAEGASHNIYIEVSGAATEEDAVEVGRAVARNNLFKAAVYGNDPNWGRILAAVGTTSAQFDPYDIDVSINGLLVSSKGAPAADRKTVDLTPRKVSIGINLKAGEHAATILTNDLTVAYVQENSAYSS